MQNDTEQTWSAIAEWARANAPASATWLQPAPPPAGVMAAAEASGVEWPPELVSYFSAHGGVSRSARLLPGCAPLGLTEALGIRAMMLRIAADLRSGDDDSAKSLAGERTFLFHPGLLPVGDDTGGGLLVVDLRPGPMHGYVTQYDAENGGTQFDYHSWPSIGNLLTEVLLGLTTGEPVTPHWRASVVDDEVDWEVWPPPAQIGPDIVR